MEPGPIENQKSFHDIIGGQFAQRLCERQDPFGWTASDQELVEWQEESAYFLNADLKRILPAAQKEEAAATLEELRLLNNQFSGAPVVNALAKLELNGELLALSELIWNWMQQYLEMRIQKHNPKDQTPVRKFKRLCTEYYNFIVDPYFKPNTIGHPLRMAFAKRVVWVLSEKLLQRSYIVKQPAERMIVVTNADTDELIEPAEAEEFFEAVTASASLFRWHVDCLPSFFRMLQEAVAAIRSTQPPTILDRDTLLFEISQLAKDVPDMRCFLAGAKPGNIHVTVGDIVVGLSWTVIDGLFELQLGRSDAELKQSIFLNDAPSDDPVTRPSKIIVRYDGLIADCYRPDVTSSTDVEWLELNLLVLQQIYARLFASYEAINFGKYRESARTGNIAEEDEVFVLETVCQRLAKNEATVDQIDLSVSSSLQDDCIPVPHRKQTISRLRRVRLEQLRKVLSIFGCQIETSKGSELKVCRDGRKPFRFGRHVLNPEISVNTLRSMLNRMEIDKGDFARAAYL